MEQIGITLLGMVNTTSHLSANHQIAIWVLSNLGHLNHVSEPEMAKACNVSKSSINRFCKELGFQNFQQFQTAVLRFQRPYSLKYDPAQTEGYNPNLSTLDNYTNLVAKNAHALAENIDDDVLADIARDIDTHDQVVILGEMQSGAVALSLQHNLFSTGKAVTAYIYSPEQREVLRKLQPGTLLIIFSLFGNFFQNLAGAQAPFERLDRTKVVWITSHPVLPPTIPIDVIVDCKLDKTLAAGNLSMELVANAIVLHYWRIHHAEDETALRLNGPTEL